jgi:hypothetical protein
MQLLSRVSAGVFRMPLKDIATLELWAFGLSPLILLPALRYRVN